MNLQVSNSGTSKEERLARSILESVTEPIGKSSALPNWLYDSQNALQIEKKHIFACHWAGIGFADEVPEIGDVVPKTFLGEPLILLRDREGTIRVFQNVCRHRGMVLVKEAHNSTGLLRCPYHAWCYSLKGDLKQTPHAGGAGIHEHEKLDKSDLGLIEIPAHVYLGVVFVNLDGNAEPFENMNASLLERWKDFDRPIYHSGSDSSFELDIKTNWKLAIENFCESYHLPFVHPGLNAYSRLEDHENILGDGPWSGQLTRVYNAQLDEDGRGFDRFEDIADRWESNGEYIAVYPNVLLGVHKDHIFSMVVEPKDNGRSVEHVKISYASPAMIGPDFESMRVKNAKLWKTVFMEDIAVVEGMQMGRFAGRFDGGHFSPEMDEATHHFHVWVAKQLLASPEGTLYS